MKIITHAVLDMETMQWLPEFEESYEYSGPVDLACGGSPAQTQLGNMQTQQFQAMNSDMEQMFGTNSSIMNTIKGTLTPIVNAGPNQPGWSAAQTAATNTQIMDQNAGALAQESTALNDEMAAKGGGNVYTPAGAQADLNAALANESETNVSNQKLQATEENYEQGNKNYFAAEQALSGAPGELENPIANLSNATTGAGEAANTTLNDVAQENNAWMGMVSAGLGAAGTALAGAKL